MIHIPDNELLTLITSMLQRAAMACLPLRSLACGRALMKAIEIGVLPTIQELVSTGLPPWLFKSTLLIF